MRAINIHEAKTHLSRLVEEAARGEPFIIAKAGRPIAQVVPLEQGPTPAKDFSSFIGSLKGKVTLPPNFWEVDRELDREIAQAFEDSRIFPDDKE